MNSFCCSSIKLWLESFKNLDTWRERSIWVLNNQLALANVMHKIVFN